jgi:hypothetical protein
MSQITNQNYPNGLNPLGYLGVNAATPPQQVVQAIQAPLPTNSQNFAIGTQWVVRTASAEEIWELVNLDAGVATWVQLYPAGGGGGATEFVTDSGIANESGGIINVLGDGVNIATVGSGDTVTVNLNPDLIITDLRVTSFGAGVVVSDGSGDLSSVSPLPIARGGTNATSMATADGVVYYDGTRLVTTTAGTATYVLTSNGAGMAPTYQASGSSPASNCAFSYYQATDVTDAPSDGSFYSLGSSVALTSIYDNSGGAVYPGNGSGAAATFTAPATGLYFLSANFSTVQTTSSSGELASPRIAITGNVATANNYFDFTDTTTISGSALSAVSIAGAFAMTVGDVAQFQVTRYFTFGSSTYMVNGKKALMSIFSTITYPVSVNTYISGYRIT